MKLRIFSFIVYLVLAVALMAVLSIIIDEHMSRRQTRWDDRTREFEQAEPEGMASLRLSEKD